MKLDALLEAGSDLLELQTKLLDLDVADGWNIDLTNKGLIASKGKYKITLSGTTITCEPYRYKAYKVRLPLHVIEAMIGLCELASNVDYLISAMVKDENTSLPMFECSRHDHGFSVIYYGEWNVEMNEGSNRLVTSDLPELVRWIKDQTDEA
jgi:hypothetical protein